MEKLLYDQNQRAYLINGVQLQIDALKRQLGDLYALLRQLDSSLVDESIMPIPEMVVVENAKGVRRTYAPRESKENDKDYFTKVKQILEIEDKPLTTRAILKRIYEYYPDEFDEKYDRKNIGSLSAILTEKHAEGKIIRVKPEVGHAMFSLPNTYKQEEKQNVKPVDLVALDRLDEELNNLQYLNEEQIEEQKVDLPDDDDDLPF